MRGTESYPQDHAVAFIPPADWLVVEEKPILSLYVSERLAPEGCLLFQRGPIVQMELPWEPKIREQPHIRKPQLGLSQLLSKEKDKGVSCVEQGS